MKRLVIAATVSMLFAIAISGCQEASQAGEQNTNSASPNANRRAVMIATENLRIELNKKNARISELEKELESCKSKVSKLETQATKSAEGFMKIASDMTKKNAELMVENTSLKAQIKVLESKK